MPALAIFFLTAAAQAAPELRDRFQITEVKGRPDVKVIRGAGKREEILRRGDNVFSGDLLEAGTEQLVEISSYDGSIWYLAPGTQIKADSLEPGAKSPAYRTFRLLRGALHGKVPKRNSLKQGLEPPRIKILLKAAALGVQGAEFVVTGGDKISTVDVLEGKVWWGRDENLPSSSSKEVTAGFHAELGADGRIRIIETKGDRAKLLRDYGLSIEDGTSTIYGSARHCAALGLGWRGGAGSIEGECFKFSEREKNGHAGSAQPGKEK
jgi:hypothetical protein